MILNKKIAKLPKRAILRSSQAQQQDSFDEDEGSPYTEKKYVKRFRFRQIPQHSKYASQNPIYPIKGDIPVMLCDGNLTTEISLFNETKIFPNITIIEKYNQKLVLLKPTSRKDKRFNTIIELMDKFEASEDSGQLQWHKTFKTFYQTYEKVMKRQSRKKTKSDTRKRFYSKVDAKTREKTDYLYENFPILQLKYRLRNHQSQLYEIVFSEAFIQEMGHTVDSFVSSVLKEGLPQLMPLNNPCSTDLLKHVFNNYFTIENGGYEMPDLLSTLFMKNGYAKDVNYQMNLLMNYETNTFGMDMIYALKARGEPYLVNPKYLDTTINETFLQKMCKREEETAHFLTMYYETDVEKRYANYDKVCRIKELAMETEVIDDEIIVKKDEDA